MITVKDKSELLKRAELLREAVVEARQDANEAELPEASVGQVITDYLMGRGT
jgi:hypothetical protein